MNFLVVIKTTSIIAGPIIYIQYYFLNIFVSVSFDYNQESGFEQIV